MTFGAEIGCTTNHSISGYSKGVILLSRDVKIFSFMVRIPVYHHVFWALKRTVSMNQIVQSGQSICAKNFFKMGHYLSASERTLNAVSLAGRYTVCCLDKDRHPIVRRNSLIRVFVVNILGSLSFFHIFIR